jgi:hypothetical protein
MNVAQRGGVCRKHWNTRFKDPKDDLKTLRQTRDDREALVAGSREDSPKQRRRMVEKRQIVTRITPSPNLLLPELTGKRTIQEGSRDESLLDFYREDSAKRTKTVSFAEVSQPANDDKTAANTVEKVTELPLTSLPLEHGWGGGRFRNLRRRLRGFQREFG